MLPTLLEHWGTGALGQGRAGYLALLSSAEQDILHSCPPQGRRSCTPALSWARGLALLPPAGQEVLHSCLPQGRRSCTPALSWARGLALLPLVGQEVLHSCLLQGNRSCTTALSGARGLALLLTAGQEVLHSCPQLGQRSCTPALSRARGLTLLPTAGEEVCPALSAPVGCHWSHQGSNTSVLSAYIGFYICSNNTLTCLWCSSIKPGVEYGKLAPSHAGLGSLLLVVPLYADS